MLNLKFKITKLFLSTYILISLLQICNTTQLNSTTTSNSLNLTTHFKNLNFTQNNLKQISNDQSISTRKTNMNKILSLLMEEQANNCIYGTNPKLSDLCPHVLVKYHDVTLNDVLDSILNHTVVKKLQHKCPLGEWCLETNLINHDNKSNQKQSKKHLRKRSNLQNRNSEIYCFMGKCLDGMKNYIKKCVHSELSRNILLMAPSLCEFSLQSNQYCPEHTMRLIHVAAATFTNSKPNALPESNVNKLNVSFRIKN